MVTSTGARHYFQMDANRLVKTLELLEKQQEKNAVNNALIMEATNLIKNIELYLIDEHKRPILDPNFVRNYHVKIYLACKPVMSLLGRDFWETFSRISRVYNIRGV